MNKAELIDAVAEGADISKAAATRAVDTVIEQITNTLKSGNQVTLVGFGTFAVKARAARTDREYLDRRGGLRRAAYNIL